jgi:hypothetical protein
MLPGDSSDEVVSTSNFELDLEKPLLHPSFDVISSRDDTSISGQKFTLCGKGVSPKLCIYRHGALCCSIMCIVPLFIVILVSLQVNVPHTTIDDKIRKTILSHTDPCERNDNPCQHGGTCIQSKETESAKCLCTPGWGGHDECQLCLRRVQCGLGSRVRGVAVLGHGRVSELTVSEWWDVFGVWIAYEYSIRHVCLLVRCRVWGLAVCNGWTGL